MGNIFSGEETKKNNKFKELEKEVEKELLNIKMRI